MTTPIGDFVAAIVKEASFEEMTDTPEHHRQRSEFIRGLVQRSDDISQINDRIMIPIPRTIIQFWHNLQELPEDIERCISSWTHWTSYGYNHHLFDERSAKKFISEALGSRYERAFNLCYHPAMQSDYFRLCYLLVNGGFYVDADDECIGTKIDWLFDDSRLKVQPLCYDIASATMVNPLIFLQNNAYNPNWIFYFNNNPLVANQGHPIIEYALQQATVLLETAGDKVLPEIQTTTGPGNLSKTIFELGSKSFEVESNLLVLRDWESFAISKWPLSHRNDNRNWRLSNQQKFYR